MIASYRYDKIFNNRSLDSLKFTVRDLIVGITACVLVKIGIFLSLVLLSPYRVQNSLQPVCQSDLTTQIFGVMTSFDLVLAIFTFIVARRSRKIPPPMNEFTVRFFILTYLTVFV
jgi:hypothetical protein